MTLSEVLHAELWSKKTSEKIFKVCGALVLLLAIAVVIEFQWITPRERRLARIALSEVESLQQTKENEDTFKARKEKARAAVNMADEVAWTLRDIKVVNALLAFEALTEMDCERPAIQSKISEILGRQNPQQASDPMQLDHASDRVKDSLRQVLHNALD